MNNQQVRSECAHLVQHGPVGTALLELLERTDAPWERESPGAHITCGALVVDPVKRTMACVWHKKLGRWLQIGGHIERRDQSVLDACAREALEETGLTLEPSAGEIVDLGLFGGIECPSGIRSVHLDIRALWWARESALVCSDESLQVAWLSLDDLAQPHDEDLEYLAELAAAAIERLGPSFTKVAA